MTVHLDQISEIGLPPLPSQSTRSNNQLVVESQSVKWSQRVASRRGARTTCGPVGSLRRVAIWSARIQGGHLRDSLSGVEGRHIAEVL
jgi:hypothetical protein